MTQPERSSSLSAHQSFLPNARSLPSNRHSQLTALPKNQHGRVFGMLFLIVLIVSMVVLAFYLIKQDRVITAKFEGKRWNIPAKVYSQPLELYQGAGVSSSQIESWLEMLNYKPQANTDKTGSYQKTDNGFVIHTRGFDYSATDTDAEQVIKLQLAGGAVSSVQSTLPNDTGIVRLEPVTIGGIYPDNNEDRVVVSIEDVPQPLIDALIATEDRSFYQHKGVSLRGIARAVVNNLSGKSMQGGSTITQQLIKNFYLNSDRTLKRKANEAVMALLLELHYDKNEILQAYLNEINLGQNGNRSINGFGLASEFYFSQPLKELRVDQQAMLVGLAKGTTAYNPRRNPEAALNRRNTVLANMLAMGKISQETFDEAVAQPLDVVEKPNVGKSRFPDFLDIVKRELKANYRADDLKNEGLRIFSTLDPLAQSAADAAVDKELAKLRKKSDKTADLQAALVSANPASGELLAVVGSGSEFTGFNRAVDAKRQVGSLLKPFIYMMALDSGDYNLASPVDDNPIVLKLDNGDTWSPKNYDGRDHGYVPLTKALAKSYNQAAVHTGMQFGINPFIKELRKLGIAEDIPSYPSVLLGAVNLSPMDMLGAYQVLATGGFRTPIISIRSVVDSEGRILQRNGLDTQRSIAPDTAFLTNHALQEVVKTGTAKSLLSLGDDLQLAGKTGTTNDYRDAWFAGYSGNYVSVVWVGRDDNKPIGLSGGSGALPIWKQYMGKLRLSPVNLVQPDNIEWLWLDNGTGTLSHEQCESAKYLPVKSKYAPKEASDCAIALYRNQQALEQYDWLMSQQAQAGNEPDGGTLDSTNPTDPASSETLVIEESQTTLPADNVDNPEPQADTWYDEALEWF